MGFRGVFDFHIIFCYKTCSSLLRRYRYLRKDAHAAISQSIRKIRRDKRKEKTSRHHEYVSFEEHDEMTRKNKSGEKLETREQYEKCAENVELLVGK